MEQYNPTYEQLAGLFLTPFYKIGDRVFRTDEDPDEGYHVISGIRFNVTFTNKNMTAEFEYILDDYGYRVYNPTTLIPYTEGEEKEEPSEE